MKIYHNKTTNSLHIDTNIYQARNGALYINFANKSLQLPKDFADELCFDIPEIDIDLYKKFYKLK